MYRSDHLIHTKLRLPFTRPEMILRPRLEDQVARGLQGPLTLITAPAGFGKTTLLVASISRCAVPAAWLSLDKDDNHLGRFLMYLIAALQGADSTIGSEASQLVSSNPEISSETVLTSLVNDLDRLGVEMVLVLDDYQHINSPVIHEAVAFMLEYHPTSFHLAIVSRSDPPIPVTRMRARGQVVELRASDLRFTESEAAQFLDQVMGLQLDAGLVKALSMRTEGWIAGLQMAALSMRDRNDAAGFIEKFSGTNRYILDYLLEEVLASQPPEIQRFLLVTSILERLTAPLCDSILKIQEQNLNSENLSPPSLDSRALLEHLERENLFLVPLDDERSWYRYHHLFADLLRAQLQKSTGDRAVAKLHQYASEWYEQNGLTLDAIHHASLIPDFERMERLIEQNYVDLVNRKEMTLVRFWMGKLNEELVYRRPWLCLYEALNRSWFGNLEESALYLSIADKYIQSADPTPDTQAMIGYRSYVQSRNTALRGDTRRAIEYCLEAREKTPSSNHGLHVEIGITLGYEYFLEGDFTNAKKVIDGIIQLSEELRAVNTPVAGYALLARIKNILGRLHDSQALYQKSSSLVESAGGQYLGATGITEVGIAALFCEWNDLETALVRMKKGLSLLPMWGKPDDLALAYTHLFRIQLALGDRAEAGDVIEKAARLVQSHSVFPEARNALEASQVKLWLLNEDWPAIDRWVASLPDRGGSRDSIRYADEIPQITLARVFIFQNKYEDAVRLLSGLEESARAGCRGGRLIEVMILKALALQAMGKNTQAIAALTKSLELAQPEGYVRLFLDERQPMRTLLARWAAQAEPGTFRDYAVYLLSQFEPVPEAVLVDHKKPAITGGLVEPLSPRELEVLALIAEGKTNREIARQLVVALGTVKAHAASIYRKLDVTNRTEAVARARQLGFLT